MLEEKPGEVVSDLVEKKLGPDAVDLAGPLKPIATVKDGLLSVVRTYKEGKVIKAEETEEERIQVGVFHTDTARIGFQCRMTINLGDFESVQVGVECTLPSYKEELPAAFETAKQFVESRFNKEVSQIREYRSKKGKKE